MMRASHTQPGFLAALLHRLSGIALAIFLPLHFLALATALDGAANTPVVKLTEGALVAALAMHMGLGLRVLAIEFLNIRERTVAVLSGCAATVFAVALAFLLNAG
jgi:fumarate reductase subunit D